MFTKKQLSILIAVGVILLALGIGPRFVLTAFARPPAQDVVSTGITISYSGQLTGDDSEPVADGVYDFTFTLYDAPDGGSLLWSEAQTGVSVQGGVFTVILGSVNPLPATIKDGTPWLGTSVRGPQDLLYAALTPRQQLSAVLSSMPSNPTAAGTCEHTHFGESWSGSSGSAGLVVTNNNAGGDGIRGYTIASGVNMAGIFGVNSNTGAGGPGVYGVSMKQAGVFGIAASSTTLTYIPGGPTGVYGIGPTGVFGYASGAGAGDGVVGTTTASGKSGVYGVATNSYGVTGRSTNSAAVAGISENSRGVYGEDAGTNTDDSYAVYANGDIYTDDDLTVLDHLNVSGVATFSGGKVGFVVDVAQNDDTVSLEVGDVVIISGAGPALLGEIPMIKVRLARVGETSAVIGVVDQRYVPAPTVVKGAANEDAKAEAVFDESAIAPGEYLTIVTLGSFKAIKVDASYGAIAPGDLLVASPNPGYAMRATSPAPGTIIGKALMALESGTGIIPVIITMQ